MRKRHGLRPSRRSVLAGGAALGLAAASRGAWAETDDAPKLPPAPRDGTVELFHGVAVPDPFRPLEDSRRADVKAWVAAQDERTRAYLDKLAIRDPTRNFMDELLDYAGTTIPERHGTRYFTFFNDTPADQSNYGVQHHLGGPRQILINASLLAPDGSIAIVSAFPDREGEKVAYLLSEAGSDQETLRVRSVLTGEDLPDIIRGCKHTNVAWAADGRSFYYARYPNEQDPPDWERRSQVLLRHRLGDPPSADSPVFRLPALHDVYIDVESEFASEILKIIVAVGTSEKAGYYVAPLDEPARARELVPPGAFGFSPVANVGATHYAVTNLNAPNWRLVRIDQSDPAPERWHTVVPETAMPLEAAAIFDARLVVRHLDGVGARVSVRDLDGQPLRQIDYGDRSNAWFGYSYTDDDYLLVGVEDYLRPSRIEWIDIDTGQSSLFRPSDAKYDLSDAVVREVFVTSRDGTRVPLVLIHQPDLVRDGSQRTLLTGYGAYGISLLPEFREGVAAWVRLGGVYALASVRGGGEYGQAWHDAGRLANKQNGIDDFIAAAEWLVANRYARPDRLGSYGRSAGGLLVLAAMLQRPDLFGAVVAGVPITDMLRFDKFTLGSNWTVEFGDPAREADFKALRAYSPLHNVRRGVKYPPLLVMTADHDDRVAPAHAYKFVATMHDLSPKSETHLHVERRAGHGGTNPLGKRLDDTADTLAFLCAKLGGTVQPLPKLGG
jgi:prolyl oligopeptidase